MQYDPKYFTWGFEIEWGDIDRRLELPKELGKFEYSETDIVNKQPPFTHVSCDPQGIEPYMGGEINTVPTKTWQEQVDKIMNIKKFFEDNGNIPYASCVSHSHVHVYVPGLKDDIDGLKRLIKYIRDNQDYAVDYCGGFKEHKRMKEIKNSKMYLKYDGGRRMPEYMIENILNLATDFPSFIKMHSAGKDGVSMGRPFRYAFNTYSMKHIGTIEFRFFRASTEREELSSVFRFLELFMDAALNEGPSVKEILSCNTFKFPPFVFDFDAIKGWNETKYDKSRGQKQREFQVIED